MTFVEYARCRRIGIAFNEIRKGESVIEAQLNSGYESSSGFRDAFAKIMKAPPTKLDLHVNILKATWIDTPIGPMIGIADEDSLYLLEFADRRGLELEIEKLRKKTGSTIIPGKCDPIISIEQELSLYFLGELKEFKTNLKLMGSIFQKLAWDVLCKIPYGETRSYMEQAKRVGNPKAVRAVARANGANQIAIVIPCHRIINNDGKLGGYGGGVARKEWLINHEKTIVNHT